MSIISGTAKSAGGFYDYPIEQSLRFDGSSYLSRTPTTSVNSSHTTYTYSVWLKYDGKKSGNTPNFGISAYSTDTNNPRNSMEFMPDSDEIRVSLNPSGLAWHLSQTNRVFRDLSAWYHIVLAVDMNQSQEADRAKIYVNSNLATYRVLDMPNQYTELPVNTTNVHYIGIYGSDTTISQYKYRGYLANIQFIDGQALDPYFFGESKNGVWIPYNAFSTAGSGTATASDGDTATDSYGTNGFHLTFEDATSTTTLGYDYSGNNNHWTLN